MVLIVEMVDWNQQEYGEDIGKDFSKDLCLDFVL